MDEYDHSRPPFRPLKSNLTSDAVGNRVTPVPPHRSRRAAFPHRAPIEGQTRSRVWTPPIRRLAASVTCLFRSWARGMRPPPPSLRSAAFPPPSPPLTLASFVRGFIGTMQPSDSSPLPRRLRLLDFPSWPASAKADWAR